MEALWNQANLQKPPYRSWKVPTNKFDVKKFTSIIEIVFEDFCTFESLNSEAALLSRLIYRMKSKFRSDKGLKEMEKLNRALLCYLNMNLKDDYELLRKYVESNNRLTSLPSRQVLEYVLVRTQGFGKLMCRAEETSRRAGNYLKSRMSIGQSWTVAMIAYSIVSKIWMLVRLMVKKTCLWYKEIHSFVHIFKIMGVPWLPSDYELPNDLTEWLSLDWINQEFDKTALGKSIFDLIETEPTANNDLKKTIGKQSMLPEQIGVETDFGEPISREVFQKTSKKMKEVNLKKSIKSEKQLVKFLKSDTCSGLNQNQWSILRSTIKKLAMKLMKKHKGKESLPPEMFVSVNEVIKNWKNLSV